MARRRFRSNQRHEPVTERSFQEYLYSSGAPQTSRTELMRLVRAGEDTYLELKVKLSNSERIAQEIVALANTGGGVIVFGVNDQLRVEGIEDGENVQDELVRICREEVVPPDEPPITLSIGVVSSPEHGEESGALIEIADRAMYRAKAAGEPVALGDNADAEVAEEAKS